jgi:hypothetical protein
MHKPSSQQAQSRQEQIEGYQASANANANANANYCPIRASCKLVSSKNKQCVYSSGTRVYKFRSDV